MQKQRFHQCLDGLADYLDNASEIMVFKHPDKIKGQNHDRQPPLKGHTVVLAYHPTQQACDWCHSHRDCGKTFSRSVTTGAWTGKCETCGERRKFTTIKDILINNCVSKAA